MVVGGMYKIVVTSWKHMDGCCYFLEAARWLLLLPGGIWMVEQKKQGDRKDNGVHWGAWNVVQRNFVHDVCMHVMAWNIIL